MKKQLRIIIVMAAVALTTSCKTSHTAKHADTSGAMAVKADTPLEGTYWKLVELGGQRVAVDSSYTHEPYLIVQSRDSSAKGNGGCNGFGGSFAWKAPNRISISHIISTMMACEKIQQENEYFKMLQMADNYYVIADTLILNKAKMAPLARFVSVYMK